MLSTFRKRPDASADQLVRRLFAADTSPSNRVIRQERHERLKGALASPPERNREVLVMRHLEQVSTAEIAAKLEISEPVVKSRILRTLIRMREQLGDAGVNRPSAQINLSGFSQFPTFKSRARYGLEWPLSGPYHENVCRNETRIDLAKDLRDDRPCRRIPPGRLPCADPGLRDFVREAAGTLSLRDDRAFARGFSRVNAGGKRDVEAYGDLRERRAKRHLAAQARG